VIYLYAITLPTSAGPTGLGLDDAPLQVLRSSGVAAIYSDHDQTGFRPHADALWRHDQVVEAAMRESPALPARFGTTFADVDALAAALDRQGSLRRQLDRIRGCVELAVRVALPGATPAARLAGGEYLRVKLARQHERRTAADETLEPLARLAVRAHSELGTADNDPLTASFLVRADDVERFADEVRRLAARHPGLGLSCTGPWPPYSFVGEEAA
jgi:Gas vesicle synthesis protein GvpL/GvpF